jgi:uncharacterized phage protein (TIGR01671 family)
MKMDDRYLFKAKRIDNGEWVQGVPFEIEGKMVILIKDNENFLRVHYIEENMWNAEIYAIEVEPDTICQCTGLKDKNGNLIWENDIIAYWDTYSTENGQAEADCIGKVMWDDETLSFYVTNRLSAESHEVLDECSVIGNVFDNPELLESEE